MFPAKVETPKVEKTAKWIPTIAPESKIFSVHDKSAALKSTEKQASKTSKVKGTDQEAVRLLKQGQAHLEHLKLARDTSAQASREALTSMVDSVRKLAGYFRTAGHTPFADCEAYAIDKYGEQGAKLMKLAWSLTKGEELREKRAALGKKPKKLEAVKPVDKLIEDSNDKARKYIEAVKKSSAASQEHDKFDKTFKKLASEMTKVSLGLVGTSMMSWYAPELKKKVMPDTSKIRRDSLQTAMEGIADPDFDAELHNINTQVMLKDMMTRDAVIKRHPPEKVLQAYNELAKTAPRVVGSPMILRALLRRSLEGEGIDPFEAGQILNIETSMKKRDDVRDQLSTIPSYQEALGTGGGGDRD